VEEAPGYTEKVPMAAARLQRWMSNQDSLFESVWVAEEASPVFRRAVSPGSTVAGEAGREPEPAVVEEEAGRPT
jgi:hypothetical protein